MGRKGQPSANDPGYRPEWKDRVRKRLPGPADGRLAFRINPEFVVLLAKAARLRGMTSAAYSRRAVAAFIANDLQVPFEDICTYTPRVNGRQVTQDGRRFWPRDDGQGYGNWEVKP